MRALLLSLIALFCLTQPAVAQVGARPRLADTYQRDTTTGNLYAGVATAPHRAKLFLAVGCPHCRDYYLKGLPGLMDYLGVDQGKTRFDLMIDNLGIGGARAIAETSYCLPPEAARTYLVMVFTYEKSYMLYDEKSRSWSFRSDFLPAVLKATGLSPAQIAGVQKCTVTYAADISRIIMRNNIELSKYPDSQGRVGFPTVVLDGVRLTAGSKIPKF